MTEQEHPEVTRLKARVAELEGKVSQLRSSNGALMVDADRREQRAARIAQDCGEHGREITYLRHMTSWYWESMTVSDQARAAIVTANLLTARDCLSHEPEATVKAAEVAAWLTRNADAQKRPFKRQGYPTLADCVRAGGCEHDGLSEGVKADIAAVLGLAVPTA